MSCGTSLLVYARDIRPPQLCVLRVGTPPARVNTYMVSLLLTQAIHALRRAAEEVGFSSTLSSSLAASSIRSVLA